MDVWLNAVGQIVDKATLSRALAHAAWDIKSSRIEYRVKASQFNASITRPESEEQLAFALMVYQTASAVIAELKAQRNRHPESQFPSYRSPVAEVSDEDLDALTSACSFEAILAAIRGDASDGADDSKFASSGTTPQTEETP